MTGLSVSGTPRQNEIPGCPKFGTLCGPWVQHGGKRRNWFSAQAWVLLNLSSTQHFLLQHSGNAGRLFTAQRRGIQVSRDQPFKSYDLSANCPGHLTLFLSTLPHSALTPQAGLCPRGCYPPAGAADCNALRTTFWPLCISNPRLWNCFEP